MHDGEPPQYPLTSVDNALRILLLLKSRPSIRVSEAARELGVVRSTAHRLLGALVYRGFALQDTSRQYRAGPVLVEIGMGALSRLDVRNRSRPMLERLVRLTGETSSLQILEGTECRFIDSVESAAAVRVGSRAGINLPAHLASGGKAMLAALPEGALRSLYPDEQIKSTISDRVVSRSELLENLAQIREIGYAVNPGETSEGVVAIGAGLRDSDGMPVAAFAIAGPVYRMTPEKVQEIASILLAAVAEFEDARYF
jgi:DNA-binding IclR family transcriptional regulator